MLERDGEGRKDKGGCEGSRSKKSCMWRVVYKGLKRRAHWRAHTAQIRTFFSCTANGNCGARDFFPRWVKTIGEVPGSNASDMQQCGNSEAIRSEINSCDGSLLCKVTIKSFADTILYVCCCYYVWLFDGLSTCADHEPQQWDSSSVHRILSQSNPHTTIHNTTERNYCNASISAKLAARTKNTWQNTWQQDNHEYANHIYKYHMRKQAVQRTQPKWHEPSAPMLLPTLNQSHLHRTEMQARPVLPPVARCPWMRKERYLSAKLIELPWWQTLTTGKELNETSSLARTCGTNTHPFFFAPPTSTAAHAISSYVESKSRLVDSIGGIKCTSISVALLTIISSGALVYEFQRKIIHAPEFRMKVLQDINASVHTLKRHLIAGCSTRRNGS